MLEILETITGLKHVDTLEALNLEICKMKKNPECKKPIAVNTNLDIPEKLANDIAESGIKVVRYGIGIDTSYFETIFWHRHLCGK